MRASVIAMTRKSNHIAAIALLFVISFCGVAIADEERDSKVMAVLDEYLAALNLLDIERHLARVGQETADVQFLREYPRRVLLRPERALRLEVEPPEELGDVELEPHLQTPLQEIDIVGAKGFALFRDPDGVLLELIEL